MASMLLDSRFTRFDVTGPLKNNFSFFSESVGPTSLSFSEAWFASFTERAASTANEINNKTLTGRGTMAFVSFNFH
jgi:hypothetical protein